LTFQSIFEKKRDMISTKHMATFLMGVAAGAAIMKYNSMTKEEQEELLDHLKKKADEVKEEAETAVTQLQTYFEDLKGKGLDALQGHMGGAEQMIKDFVNNINNKGTNPSHN
jgi:gas vesicle protein